MLYAELKKAGCRELRKSALHAALGLVSPLLGAFLGRELHVYARRPGTNFAKVPLQQSATDVADLQAAVCAALRVDVSPDLVRLLLLQGKDEEELRVLNGNKSLEEECVLGGSSVELQVMPPPLSLPPPIEWSPLPTPLTFQEEILGGEEMKVATLEEEVGGSALPFFLTPSQYDTILNFLSQKPSRLPTMLMVTGTVKSGKTCIVHTIIPGLLAALYQKSPATLRRPVVFKHTFRAGRDTGVAFEGLMANLRAFALALAMPLPPSNASEAEYCISGAVLHLAKGVEAQGGQLWVLLDELGAPVVAAPLPSEASNFIQVIKDTLLAVNSHARVVGTTGSGMVTLLHDISQAAPNGYSLWGALKHVVVGREPKAPLALAMAHRLHAHLTRQWPPSVARAVSPHTLLDTLAPTATGGLTSPRPALVVTLLDLMGDVQGVASSGDGGGGGGGGGSTPLEALQAAKSTLLVKLGAESRGDTAVGLSRMSPAYRLQLKTLAQGGAPLSSYPPLQQFVDLLCEERGEERGKGGDGRSGGHTDGTGTALPPHHHRFLPPYATLFYAWIRRDGMLSVVPPRMSGGGVRGAHRHKDSRTHTRRKE